MSGETRLRQCGGDLRQGGGGLRQGEGHLRQRKSGSSRVKTVRVCRVRLVRVWFVSGSCRVKAVRVGSLGWPWADLKPGFF